MLSSCNDNNELTDLKFIFTVVVAASNPFVKKSLFINTLEGIHSFTRRDWSFVVVDNDAMLAQPAVLMRFNADFKIWITAVDMKVNNCLTFSPFLN
jgi:hypothetical protein